MHYDNEREKEQATTTCKTKKITSDRELIDLLTLEPERKDKSHGSITALEAIRCGIGGNFGGEYYDEMIELVLNPILEYINKQQGY